MSVPPEQCAQLRGDVPVWRRLCRVRQQMIERCFSTALGQAGDNSKIERGLFTAIGETRKGCPRKLHFRRVGCDGAYSLGGEEVECAAAASIEDLGKDNKVLQAVV